MDFTFIPKAVAQIVRVVRQNPLASLLTTFLFTWVVLIVIVASLFITNFATTMAFVDKWYPTPVTEAQRLTESVPRDDATCKAIDRLGALLGADRATYWAFSNGTFGTNGVSWNYASIGGCPYTADGIAPLTDFSKQPNSVAVEINKVLLEPSDEIVCGRWTIDDLKTSYLRATMRSVGSDVLYECVVRDRNAFAIGKIIVSWRNRKLTPPDEKIFAAIREASERVGAANTLDPGMQSAPSN